MRNQSIPLHRPALGFSKVGKRILDSSDKRSPSVAARSPSVGEGDRLGLDQPEIHRRFVRAVVHRGSGLSKNIQGTNGTDDGGSIEPAEIEDATVDACGAGGNPPMPTRLYRFHCTDGRDLVVDLRGKRLPTLALMRLHAERVALDLMLHGDRLDWSRWTVEVYDVKGWLLMSKAFTDVRGEFTLRRAEGQICVLRSIDVRRNPSQVLG